MFDDIVKRIVLFEGCIVEMWHNTRDTSRKLRSSRVSWFGYFWLDVRKKRSGGKTLGRITWPVVSGRRTCWSK